MYKKAQHMKADGSASATQGGRVAVQRACLFLLPLLAVIPFLLPVAFLDAPLRADGGDSGPVGSTNSGTSLKAPKNSGGFVINLPNSQGSQQRLTYATGLMGESLGKALARYLSGQINFVAHTWGTEATRALATQTCSLASFGADGSTTIALLLPTKDFRMGGLASVEVAQKSATGSKRGSQIPTTVYFTITSDNLMLDVPAVIAAAVAGNNNDFTLRFYDLSAQEKVRVDLHVDVDGNSVHLIF